MIQEALLEDVASFATEHLRDFRASEAITAAREASENGTQLLTRSEVETILGHDNAEKFFEQMAAGQFRFRTI